MKISNLNSANNVVEASKMLANSRVSSARAGEQIEFQFIM